MTEALRGTMVVQDRGDQSGEGDGQSLRAAPDATAVPEALLEGLRHEFEELGLTGNEAIVLVAMLRLGTCTISGIAGLCSIARPNIYKLVEELEARQLVERLPSDGPATWETLGREETVDRLCRHNEGRLRELEERHRQRLLHVEERAEHVKRMLARELPGPPSAPVRGVRLIQSAAEATTKYDELLAAVQTEMLMFTRPPFAAPPARNSDMVLAALRRGVKIRVLYPAAMLDDATAVAYRRYAETCYHPAGVQGRVTPELPMKLVVFDRSVSLVGLADSGHAPSMYPTLLHIDHPGFAVMQALAFEQLWQESSPYPGASASARE
ncbi:MAG: TrmB family transcriptional regulator [Candidatus Dormibacteria bacterium]